MNAYAMMGIELDCMKKGKLTILHTNYRISTMKNGDDFHVSPGVERKMIGGFRYDIYHFLNGDMYIHIITNNNIRDSHIVIFNDGEKIKCKMHKIENTRAVNLKIKN